MKKFLPKTNTSRQGFTLIELLVVISIIAVLAVIAVTIFSGVQARARDARRRADVTAIAKAFEANKAAGSAVYTTTANPTLAAWFAGATIPVEPAGYVPQYTLEFATATGFTVNPPLIANWADTAANPTTASTTTPAGGALTQITFAAGLPAAAATSIFSFQICARLETPAAVFCVPNSQ